MSELFDLIEHCMNESNSTITQIVDMMGKLLANMLENDTFIELRTPMGKALGRYIKATNTTQDMMGRALSKGNTLMTLLKE
jgi:hypothetical protein